ncbi:MAG: hypothetical protein ABS913_08865 [Desemzia incerta]|uniref:hypothetical protein n=1 Tax=Desemzia incerta TaxID=82801 RepID=UPI0033161BD6
MNDKGNNIFKEILKTGIADPNSIDKYSKNYLLIQEQIEEFAGKEPEQFIDFITDILTRAILLPIQADNQDTALTIFSTLNDKGLALSDADIFEAKIYNHLSCEEKPQFIEA